MKRFFMKKNAVECNEGKPGYRKVYRPVLDPFCWLLETFVDGRWRRFCIWRKPMDKDEILGLEPGAMILLVNGVLNSACIRKVEKAYSESTGCIILDGMGDVFLDHKIWLARLPCGLIGQPSGTFLTVREMWTDTPVWEKDPVHVLACKVRRDQNYLMLFSSMAITLLVFYSFHGTVGNSNKFRSGLDF